MHEQRRFDLLRKRYLTFLKRFYQQNSFKSEKDITLTIVTRTHLRPKSFEKCYRSVHCQTYSKIQHLIIYDDEKCLEYLQNYQNIDLVFIQDQHYNLYLNRIYDQVRGSYVLILDDDDCLLHEKSIESMIYHMKCQEGIIVSFWTPLSLLPPSRFETACGQFAISSLCFHKDLLLESKFQMGNDGDYAFFEPLLKKYSFDYLNLCIAGFQEGHYGQSLGSIEDF